jgi:hypothetical protein
VGGGEGNPRSAFRQSLLGGGTQLTPALSTDAELVLEDAHMLPEGAVEIVYACS